VLKAAPAAFKMLQKHKAMERISRGTHVPSSATARILRSLIRLSAFGYGRALNSSGDGPVWNIHSTFGGNEIRGWHLRFACRGRLR
jgi:hypothetical protein